MLCTFYTVAEFYTAKKSLKRILRCYWIFC